MGYNPFESSLSDSILVRFFGVPRWWVSILQVCSPLEFLQLGCSLREQMWPQKITAGIPKYPGNGCKWLVLDRFIWKPSVVEAEFWDTLVENIKEWRRSKGYPVVLPCAPGRRLQDIARCWGDIPLETVWKGAGGALTRWHAESESGNMESSKTCI